MTGDVSMLITRAWATRDGIKPIVIPQALIYSVSFMRTAGCQPSHAFLMAWIYSEEKP